MTARYLNRDQGCRHRNSLVPDTCGSRVHDLCSSATAVGALNGNWSIGHVQWHCGVVCHDCHPGVWSWWLAQLSVLRTQPGLAARMPAAVRCASFWNCSLHIKKVADCIPAWLQGPSAAPLLLQHVASQQCYCWRRGPLYGKQLLLGARPFVCWWCLVPADVSPAWLGW